MRVLLPVLALFMALSRPVSADLLAALAAIEYKDFSKAIQELEPLAEKGDSQAEYLLGKLLLEGHGGGQAIERGMGYLTKAAERDYGQAQAMLGFIYANGIGIAADPAAAQKWLTRSLDRLGRGPARRRAEATLAALKEKGLIADEAPPLPATPIPEVTETPIAGVEEAPPQVSVPAEIAAREPPILAERPAEPAAEQPDEPAIAAEAPPGPASVAGSPPEPAILGQEELPATLMEGSVIGPAMAEPSAASDIALDSAQGLGTVEATPQVPSLPAYEPGAQSAYVYESGAQSAPVYEPGRRAPLPDDRAAPDDRAVTMAEGPALAPAVEAIAPVQAESASNAAQPVASLPEPVPARAAPEPAVEDAGPGDAGVGDAGPGDDIAASENVDGPGEKPAEEPAAAENRIATASVPDILPRLAPAVAPSPELVPEIASAPLPPQASSKGAVQAQPKNNPGIRIQLAAVPDRTQAESEWKRILGRNGNLLAGRRPIFMTIDLGEQGVFHRIQTGPFADLGAARELCAELIKAGQDCLVMGR